MESLEEIVGKPDPKQWIPVYGLYQTFKDVLAGKPSLFDPQSGLIKGVGSGVYHFVTSAVILPVPVLAIRYGIQYLLEKLQ